METKRPRKKRKAKPIDQNKILIDILVQVSNDGYSSIKLSSLFHRFGYKKRGLANIELINQYLKELKFYTFPVIDMSLSWDRQIRIYNFPVEALGDLFKSESQLEEYIMDNEAYKQLDVVEVVKQYKPFNTKDRLDFKGVDKAKKQVVLELKNKDG
jgi:hypothetical protein